MKKLKIGSKSGLRYFNTDDIRAWGPCYSPTKYIPENWRGTAIDILDLKDVPPQDKLWVVLRADITSERIMRLFAVWCARQVQHLMTDARSIAALDVAERFANGLASQEELNAAWSAAWSAARDAAGAAARDAAGAAARYAAGAAAGAAAWSAARDAAWDAQVDKLKDMLLAEGKERALKRKGKSK